MTTAHRLRRHVLWYLLLAFPFVSCFYLNEAPRTVPVQLPAYSILSKNLCLTKSQTNDVKSSSSSVRMMAPASSAQQRQRSTTATTLRAMADEYPLWERLGGGPGAKVPKWYIINCVATKEMDLLAQCRSATAEMSREDVVKFVVPLERNTRSHGAKRIVTQNKVKYPGYVFAKLRLFAQTYEAIQGLPLTRSWMGTISTTRRKPPIPMCLRKEEIEKFGLEDMEETDVDALESHNRNTKQKMDKNGLMIIDDDVDDDDEDGSDSSKVDMEALKVYEGLKVDDMVKVTSKEEAFFNEDGVIRRLNDGKILVRFYTYGQLFEQWMGPKDVRKLKAEEILKGLTPSKPITQQDVDRLQDRRSGGSSSDNRFAQPSFTGNNRFGDRDQGRNRRQDRNEQRFLRSDNDRPGTEERENLRSYQDQQQRNSRTNDSSSSFRDRDSARTSSPPGTRDWNSNSNDRGGRNTERYNSSNNAFAGSSTARTFDRSNDRRDDNRRYGDNYERGNGRQRNDDARTRDDDWNAFVSNREQGRSGRTPPPPEQDDFFASLMKDLNKDVAGTVPDETQSRRQSSVGNTRNAPAKRRDDNEDDFFASLLNDLPKDSQAPPTKFGSDDRGRRNQSGSRGAGTTTAFDGDDFFATLEADLEKAVSSQQYSDAANSARGKGSDLTARGRSSERDSAPSSPRAVPGASSSNSDIDDFFASLEAELNRELGPSNTKVESEIREPEDFVGRFSPTKTEKPVTAKSNPGLERPAMLAAGLKQGLSPSVKRKAEREDGEPEVLVGPFVPANAAEEAKTARNPAAKTEKSFTTASSSVPSGAVSGASLTKKTVPVLKEMLRERGLKVGGNKAELVERLLQSSSS